MHKLEKYTGDKVYMFPNGARADKEAVLAQFPAALDFTFVVTTDKRGEVMIGMDNLSVLRDIHNIDDSLTDDEAIAALQAIADTPAPEPEYTEVSDQTRIADALEDLVVLQELNSMEV